MKRLDVTITKNVEHFHITAEFLAVVTGLVMLAVTVVTALVFMEVI